MISAESYFEGRKPSSQSLAAFKRESVLKKKEEIEADQRKRKIFFMHRWEFLKQYVCHLLPSSEYSERSEPFSFAVL